MRPGWSCCCLLLCTDNIAKLFLCVSLLSKVVLEHRHVSLATEACSMYYPGAVGCCVCFAAYTSPPNPNTLTSLTAISQFTKSNLVCRVVVEATNVRLIDDTRNGCRFRSSKPVRQSRLHWQEEARQSTGVVSETQREEICHRKSL